MRIVRHDKKALRSKYDEKRPKYERLARNLKHAFESFLDDKGIDVLGVVFRIKKFDSLWDKIQRKDYKVPFQEIEDICGLRIICYYSSDVERVSQIIVNEFNVLESVDKADLLEPDRFGYRSLHFIVTVKKAWLRAPNYRGLNGLKAEVQVRTILMHAWADIEHMLAYKKTEHVPRQFRRKLYRLSAQFEGLDEQLDGLRKEKEAYVKHLLSEKVRESGRFDISQAMNLDSLQAFLDFYFPDRSRSLDDTSSMLDRINALKLSLKDLVENFERVREILPAMEIEAINELQKDEKRKSKSLWTQGGCLRTILDLTNDSFFHSRQKIFPKHVLERTKKWRAKLKRKK